MLGHELRNPMAPISNALELMRRDESESRTMRKTREMMERQFKQLNRLVDDLLDVGRITSGKVHLKIEPVSLWQALAESMEAVRPMVERKAQLLSSELGAVEPRMMGDKARMAQIFTNLLGNAAKFTPLQGRIAVQVRLAGDGVSISVRDNGVGVARKLRTTMLNPPALIAVTGYGQPSDREASSEAGFVAHLTKPVDFDKLLDLLDRHARLPPAAL